LTVPSPSQEGHPTGAGYQRPPPLRRHRRRPRPLQPRRGGAAGRPARPTNELGRHANLGLVRPGGSHAHDRGAVLRDLVVLLADGGGCVSDLASLREQAGCSGGSARPRPRGGWSGRSPPTLVGWRRCDRRRRPRPPPRRLGLRAVVAGPFGLSTGHPGDLPPRAAPSWRPPQDDLHRPRWAPLPSVHHQPARPRHRPTGSPPPPPPSQGSNPS